jgi:hypothetical protein
MVPFDTDVMRSIVNSFGHRLISLYSTQLAKKISIGYVHFRIRTRVLFSCVSALTVQYQLKVSSKNGCLKCDISAVNVR